MSVKKFRMGSLADKHEDIEESLVVKSEREEQEEKIKSSKKPAPNKINKK